MSIITDKVFNTQGLFAPLTIRIMLGLVIFAHGVQKLFGWFGGYGFSGTMGFFTDTIGLPWLIGLLIIFFESFGAVALLAGIGTRIVAGFYVLLAFGIVFSSHIQNGFFMNWFDNQQGEGFEYFLLWIGMAISLVLTGGGKYSIDYMMLKKTGS